MTRLSGPALEVDLSRWGFGRRVIEARELRNIYLLQGNAERLPFQNGKAGDHFDLVCCVNLLDRVEHPAALLDEIARVLAPQGLLVLTSPLNWRSRNGDEWSRMGTVQALQDELHREA